MRRRDSSRTTLSKRVSILIFLNFSGLHYRLRGKEMQKLSRSEKGVTLQSTNSKYQKDSEK